MSDLPLPDPTPEIAVPGVLDIQHDTDPEQDHGLARHIPHLGHAAMFFSLAFFTLVLCTGVAGGLLHITSPEQAVKHPLAFLLAQALAYVITLGLAVWLFPKLWQRSFSLGISWVPRVVRTRWWLWIVLGCIASQIAVYAQHLVKEPADSDLARLLQTPRSAWTLVVIGGLLFPLMEEISFRGFLLPAFATAYDWLSLERTPAARERWQRSSANSLPALIFAAIFSSLAFAVIHGTQLHWAKGPLGILFCVSLLFSAVRVRTRSVAACTLMHIAYDGLLFLQLAVQSGGFHHLDKLK